MQLVGLSFGKNFAYLRIEAGPLSGGPVFMEITPSLLCSFSV